MQRYEFKNRVCFRCDVAKTTDLQIHLQVVEQKNLQQKLLPSHDVCRKVKGRVEALRDGELQQERYC